MNPQLDIFSSAQKRDEGMQKAVDHANRAVPRWGDMAYELLKKFLAFHVGPFMAEEVRSYAAMIDFPEPPHARAWGAVIARAAREGLIQSCGTGKVRNVKAHRANAAIWKQVKKAS